MLPACCRPPPSLQTDDLAQFIGIVEKRFDGKPPPMFMGGQSMGGLVAAHMVLLVSRRRRPQGRTHRARAPRNSARALPVAARRFGLARRWVLGRLPPRLLSSGRRCRRGVSAAPLT